MGSFAGVLFSLWLISGMQAEKRNVQILNMSVMAFDDQYEGCTEQMEKEVLEVLLPEKKNADSRFKATWIKAARDWKNKKLSLPSGVREEYGIAITVYTDSHFHSSFNEAVRNYKGRDQFPYHAMHFLLTRALVLLGSGCPKSTTLYRGMKDISFKQKKGEKIRFGQFASTSASTKEAKTFGNDTFFTLTSHFGVPIEKYSLMSKETEVLIPVDEVFEVTRFTEVGDKSRFVLKKTGSRCHYYNCDYIKKGRKSNTCVYSEGN